MKKPKVNKIKMKTNKDENAVCRVCGHTRKNSLDLFDIAFTDKHIITICDECNDLLFSKTLKASCYVNHRLKNKKDIAIINSRGRRSLL